MSDTAIGATAFGAISAAAHGFVKAADNYWEGSLKDADRAAASELPRSQEPKPATPNPRSANPSGFDDSVKYARIMGTPLLKQGLKLEHPDEISQFVRRYSRLDRDAPALIQEAVELGKVREGTETAWRNAARSEIARRAALKGDALRADILQAQNERISLDFGVRSRLPARSEQRLIAELNQAAESDYAQRGARRAHNGNPDLDVIRGGLKQIASAVERQHLVSYIFDKYPSTAASMLRGEVTRQFGSRASGSKYAWDQAIALAERSRPSALKSKV